jgi:2-polyprenyl-6-methoxyphenol hydroxylase-like FAD-dependent oxidoreductase
LANGLNIGLSNTIGLSCEILSECHSISIGFNIKPVGRKGFEFPALTYYADRIIGRASFLTLFPIGETMRANLFVYRTKDDPWLQQFRTKAQETLFALMPGLHRFTGEFEVDGFIKIRPVDLYATRGHRQAGVVLVGDAFATSCPAAGTGARKALTDVERLCNVHIPRWLVTPGMDVEKIAAFYDDDIKKACDQYSITKAYTLRSFSLSPALPWFTRRWTKFILQLTVGTLREMQRRYIFRSRNQSSIPAVTGVRS